MNEIKIRAWDEINKQMLYRGIHDRFWYTTETINNEINVDTFGTIKPDDRRRLITMLSVGLKDIQGLNYYHGDIGEFDNGDRFEIRIERHLEFFVEWIGEPKCEDQARDFYRIRKSKKIGNIHETPELLQ